MASAKNSDVRPQAKEAWNVVVICEDELTHSQALSVCDRLVSGFWPEVEFQFHWWQFANLQEAINAHAAADGAVTADMIVWATHAEGDFPQYVTDWVQIWVGKRGNREGALVALVGYEHERRSEGAAKHLYLREVAHRANMDFLSEIPPFVRRAIPESAGWFNERAERVSSTLDEILSRTTPPPRPFE